MKHFVTFSNDYYKSARVYNVKTSLTYGGFDNAFSLSPDDIDINFKCKNAKILAYPKGAGLWLWKPWAINYALNQIAYGDYLFYTDAACYWIRSVDNIIERMNDDIWVVDNALIEEQFTKPFLFKSLGLTDDKYTKTNQRPAIFIGLRKSNRSVSFINEWLELCQNEDYIKPETDDDLSEGQNVGFISHREDQSIFSLLTKKYGITPSLNPSISGKHPEFEKYPNAIFRPPFHEPQYPNCVIHHRQRVVTFCLVLKKWLLEMLPSKLIDLYAKKKFR